jgi:hypothetical protein
MTETNDELELHSKSEALIPKIILNVRVDHPAGAPLTGPPDFIVSRYVTRDEPAQHGHPASNTLLD